MPFLDDRCYFTHTMSCPCRAVPWPWKFAFRAAWSWHGTGAAGNVWNKHYVKQIGKTQSKHFATRNGRGTARERHGNGMVLWISLKWDLISNLSSLSWKACLLANNPPTIAQPSLNPYVYTDNYFPIIHFHRPYTSTSDACTRGLRNTNKYSRIPVEFLWCMMRETVLCQGDKRDHSTWTDTNSSRKLQINVCWGKECKFWHFSDCNNNNNNVVKPSRESNSALLHQP
jgi:hypothetical protein